MEREKLFGLLELDTDGTVLYSRIDNGENVRDLNASGIRGLNFYTEVAPFKNAKEFQECLEDFQLSHQQASTIDFICQYEDGPLKVRVLMARIREYSGPNTTKSILVHFRKAL